MTALPGKRPVRTFSDLYSALIDVDPLCLPGYGPESHLLLGFGRRAGQSKPFSLLN